MAEIKLTERQVSAIKKDALWWYNNYADRTTDEDIVETLRMNIRHMEEDAKKAADRIDEYTRIHKLCLKMDGHSNWGGLVSEAKKDIVRPSIVRPIYEELIAKHSARI